MTAIHPKINIPPDSIKKYLINSAVKDKLYLLSPDKIVYAIASEYTDATEASTIISNVAKK